MTTGAPAAGGGVVARDDAGRVTFVRHALPGERVRVVLTEEHPSWARADAVEVLEASPDRVDAPCPYAGPGRCGGCDYQHVALGAQRRLKTARLAAQLDRVLEGRDAPEVEAVGGSASGLGTRTRLRYGVDDEGRLAMRKHASHELVAVSHCPLGVERLTPAEHVESCWPAGADVEVISLSALVAPTVVVERGRARRRGSTDVLERPGLAARQVVELRGHRLVVSPRSFFQVHEAAPGLLVDAVAHGLGLTGGEHVADLYCGVGLFTVMIADAVGPAGRVTGVDGSASAIADATRNLASHPWARALTATIDADTVTEVVEGCSHVVVDPPRAGVAPSVLAAISGCASVRRFVYVSCEPSTLARDLAVVRAHGWRVLELRSFDLFEMTEHLECVVVLERNTTSP